MCGGNQCPNITSALPADAGLSHKLTSCLRSFYVVVLYIRIVFSVAFSIRCFSKNPMCSFVSPFVRTGELGNSMNENLLTCAVFHSSAYSGT